MEDLFTELIVAKKPTAKDALLKALLILALLASAVLGLQIPPFMLVFLGIAIAIYFLWPRFKVEYEYSYVNGEIDIAKIFSKQSRKDLARISLEDVECVAPLGSGELDSYGATFKTVDYSAGDPEYKPYVIVKGGENSQKILVQLDEAMVEDLRRRLPRKVF